MKLVSGYSCRPGSSPAVQKQAADTVKRAMTDRFTEQLKSWARADAKRGVYMSGGCNQLCQAQMREKVSPDRSAPMGQVTSAIQKALAEPDPTLRFLNRLLDQLSGKCSAKIQIRPEGQTAELRAPNGEVIASYNSLGSGWTEIQTKAEGKFLSESAAVYYRAFQEARAEMKAAAPGPPAPDGTPAVDVLA